MKKTVRFLCLFAGILSLAILWQSPSETKAQSIEEAEVQANQLDLAWTQKIDSWVQETMEAEGEAQFFVFLSTQADVSNAYNLTTKLEKGTYVYETLRATAEKTQAPIIAQLNQLGKSHPVEYKSFWVANMILVTGDQAVLNAMAQRSDVQKIINNRSFHLDSPAPETSAQVSDALVPTAIEWNITKVGAPTVWGMGYDGTGAVIAGQDTGYLWTHVGLQTQYRGSAGNHDYYWWDSIKDTALGTGGICGINSAQPCDDHDHGTHTMGTMLGSETPASPNPGVNTVGMAPGAKWIGCRNMNVGNGAASTYSDCFQFFIAPTRVNGTSANPAMAPDVINNSWGCPTSEAGCTDKLVMLTVVANVKAAGIVNVNSAGNSGPGCNTVEDPAAIYADAFTVGSTTSTDAISGFSSRGNVNVDGSGRLKPDISAPGSNIRSTVKNGGYVGGWNGTSMAGPHVAGLVALMIDANPALAGNVDIIEDMIQTTAVTAMVSGGQNCNGTPDTVFPNNTFGYGRIDAVGAVNAALASTCSGPPSTPVLGTPANGAIDVSMSPTLSWNASTETLGYLLEVDDNSDFSSPEYSNSVTGTTDNVTGLAGNTTYYWRITANNLCGSTQSLAPQVSFSFTTIAAPPNSLFCNGTTIDFEAGLPADWTVTSSGDPSWAWVTSATCGGISLTGDSACSDPPGGNFQAGWGEVETPIDMSAFLGGSLDFTYQFDQRSNSVFQVDVWNGTAWVNELNITADVLAPTATAIDMTPYAGISNAKVRFTHSSTTGQRGEYAVFDDVVLTCTGPATTPIAGVNPASLSNTQATNTVVPSSFDVENTGTGDLNWTLFEDVSGFTSEKTAQPIYQFLSVPSKADPLAIATDYLNANYQSLGLTATDVAATGYYLKDRYVSDHTGVTHLFFEQKMGGISVYGAILQINVMPDGRILNLSNNFVPNLANSISNTEAILNAEEALQAATVALNLPFVATATELLEQTNAADQATLFSGTGLTLEPIAANLVYRLNGDSVRLAWNLSIYQLDAKHWWQIQIDAVKGTELAKDDWVINDYWGLPIETDSGQPATEAEIQATLDRWNAQANTAPSAPDVAWSPESYLFANTYKVHPLPEESPIHAAIVPPTDGRTVMTNPADPTASPFGWHDTNGAAGAEFTVTRGNNVNAYEDNSAPQNNVGAQPNGGASLDFNVAVNWTTQPNAGTNQSAAIINLFYWNNIIHDMWYHYGFNEASGNFQTNNYGNGGTQGDAVLAEAQDYGGTNNANFATPTDGGAGRMQMYLWSPAPVQKVIVTAPGGVSGSYLSADAGFGGTVPGAPGVPAGNGTYVLPQDGTGNSEGCNAFTNGGAMNGNIALIDRGSCTFAIKIENAQNAGAVAAVVMNNAPGGVPIAMGGTCGACTIPAVGISYEDGQIIRTAAGAGTLMGRLEDPGSGPNLDGDFDNGIIGHEYGHGISTRLTGGRTTNCLNNTEQMGEGWGDFIGYVMTVEPGDTGADARGIGNYAIGAGINGPGIRANPYSTNMAVDPRTYNDVMAIGDPPASPHAHGSIWAAMEWELYWAFTDFYGYDADYYTGTGGNNIATQLIVDGMKLQGCSPGFVSGRNGILSAAAALVSGPTLTQYECLIWGAFSKRGLGFSANQGSTNLLADGTAAFDMPPALVCVAQPDIDVNPATLASSQLPNVTTPDSFNIDNLGGATLNWSSIVEDPDGCGVGAPASNVAWVTGVTPTSGSTAAAGASPISFNWDSAGMTPGLYTSYLCIASDDPDEPVFQVRLDLTVTAAPEPDINVNPATLAQAQFPEIVTPDSFNIDNVGAVVLNWSSIVEDPDGCGVGAPASDVAWVTGVTPTSGSTAAAGSTTISYNWDSTGMTPGLYTSYLCIASDDPDEPVFEVTLNLTVNPPVACDFVDDISWITGMTPASGLTAPAGATTVNFNYDSTGLADGVYTASICLSSDDPVNPMIIVPVTLTVSSACSAPGDVADLAAAPGGTSVDLSWTGSGAEQYEVHRATMPYNAPVGNGPTVVSEPLVGPFTDNTIANTYGDTATNYFYYLLPENTCGMWANPSNHVGEFDFTIVPGL